MINKVVMEQRKPELSQSPSNTALRDQARLRSLLSEKKVSLGCLFLAILFYYFSVLRLPLDRLDYLNLGPYTDAVEYFAQARSLADGVLPTIRIGFDQLPSRYPAGYPALMVPWLKCLPHHSILAPFRTNQTIGLLLLIGVYAFYVAIGRRLMAGAAALLLVTLPAFFTYSRSSMSDLAGSAAVASAFALIFLAFKIQRRWPIYLAAAALGFSVCIRAQLIFFAPLLIAIALFPDFSSWRRWLLHCVLVGTLFVLASGPYWTLNAVEFGHPLTTGYDYWVPAVTKGNPFALTNVGPQIQALSAEITGHWLKFRVSNLFGAGTYLVGGFILLALVGSVFLRWDRFLFSACLGSFAYFVTTVTFSYVDLRLYLPLMLLLVSVAVLPVEWAFRSIGARRVRPLVIALLCLFVLACLGFPSYGGYPPTGWRMQAWDAVTRESQRGRPFLFNAQKEFLKQFHAAPGVVLTDIDPVYLNALWPKGFAAAPLDEKHNYCYSTQWHYGKEDAARLARVGITRGLPVYAFGSGLDESSKDSLPQITGYHWQLSTHIGVKQVMILVKSPESAASQEAEGKKNT